MQLELTAEDRRTLEQIVDRALKEMRVEVRRTTTPAYHDDLRADQMRVEKILDRLRTMDA